LSTPLYTKKNYCLFTSRIHCFFL